MSEEKSKCNDRADNKTALISKEKPISHVYPVIDNDLARDNIENDITAADLQDL